MEGEMEEPETQARKQTNKQETTDEEMGEASYVHHCPSGINNIGDGGKGNSDVDQPPFF